MSNLIRIICIIFIIFKTINLVASENRIIFKLNNKTYTSFDLENRSHYINFINNYEKIKESEILKDFISVIIFYEYYLNTKKKIDLEVKINQIYQNLISDKKINNKIGIIKEVFYKNIEYDLIRKSIIEEILKKQNINELRNNEEIDLLYNFRIKYLNIYLEEIKDMDNFKSQKFNNIEDLKFYLDNNQILYFLKTKDISNLNKTNIIIRNNLFKGNNFFSIKKNELLTFIEINQSFETGDGIIVEIISINSKQKISEEILSCKNTKRLNEDVYVTDKKEYEYNKLNDKIKKNLININDFIKFENDENYLYILLCNIKYNKEILNNINFNKSISNRFSEFEKDFIKRYSNKYNLIVYE